jgi:hypothetical protein
MLNTTLIEQFRAIHRERSTGVMTITITANRRPRFFLRGGDLEIMDLGEDKERLMARKFLDYHKIGPEIHRHTIDSCQASGQSIIETLRRQQLVNESEIQQIARSMVEDLLCIVFSMQHQQAIFSEAEGEDSFNLEGSSIRLSIQTDVMLQMVDTRIREEEEVHRSVGGWNCRFETVENSAATETLDDFERHVLNFVDGRKSIEDIAVAFRDSSLNMARLLLGMEKKGYLQRVVTGGSSTGKRQAVGAEPTPLASAQQSGPAAVYMPRGPERQFNIAPPQRSTDNRRITVVLIVVMVVMGAVGWLVHKSNVHERTMSDLNGELIQAASAHKWNEARLVTERAGQIAEAGDIDQVDLDQLKTRFDLLLEAESAVINELIAKGDFVSARELAELMPPSFKHLASLIDDEEDASIVKSEGLLKQVADLVDAGDIPGSLAALDGESPRDAHAALEYLERWKVSRIELANAPGTSFTEKQSILDLVSQARPTQTQQEQIAMLKNDLTRGTARHEEQLKQVRALIMDGNFGEAEAEAERLKLFDSQPGSALKGETDELHTLFELARSELQDAENAGLSALGKSTDRKELASAADKIKAALRKYKSASNRASLESLLTAIETIAPLAGSGSLNDEIALMKTLLTDQPSDSAISMILTPRIASLADLEASAQMALDHIRQLERDARWDEVEQKIEELLARKDWRRTSAGQVADQELALAKTAKTKRDLLQKKFDQAITAHDIGTAYALSSELGLKYLPMVVDSVPPGAAVYRGEENLGATPLIMKVDASDRSDLQLQIRLEGYEIEIMTGLGAREGWHLSATLKRKAQVSIDTNMLTTNAPSSADGRVWIAGNKQLAAVSADGKTEMYSYDKNAGASAQSLSEPVYAPVVSLDDGIFLATRDLAALKVSGKSIDRVPLAAPTSFALAAFRSPYQVNRRYLIVSGLDGIVHAMDDQDPKARWQSESGAAFACAPAVVGEVVLAARNDGLLQSFQAENGKPHKRMNLGQPITAAWATPEGLAGFTRTSSWSWAGDELQTAEIPREPVAGNAGIFLTVDKRVFVLSAGATQWQDLGQYAGDLSGEPLLWKDKAVIPAGEKTFVLGPKGFTVATTALFLSPTQIGDNLALADTAGHVWIFSP